MNWEREPRYARALARKVEAGGFKPQAVLAVSERGAGVGRAVANELGIPLETIRVQRPVSSRLKRVPFMKPVAEALKLFQAPRALSAPPSKLKGKRVLVVDNSVSSGKTISVVREELAKIGVPRGNVRVASLYYYAPPLGRSVKPDYFLASRKTRLFRPKPPEV